MASWLSCLTPNARVLGSSPSFRQSLPSRRPRARRHTTARAHIRHKRNNDKKKSSFRCSTPSVTTMFSFLPAESTVSLARFNIRTAVSNSPCLCDGDSVRNSVPVHLFFSPCSEPNGDTPNLLPSSVPWSLRRAGVTDTLKTSQAVATLLKKEPGRTALAAYQRRVMMTHFTHTHTHTHTPLTRATQVHFKAHKARVYKVVGERPAGVGGREGDSGICFAITAPPEGK